MLNLIKYDLDLAKEIGKDVWNKLVGLSNGYDPYSNAMTMSNFVGTLTAIANTPSHPYVQAAAKSLLALRGGAEIISNVVTVIDNAVNLFSDDSNDTVLFKEGDSAEDVKLFQDILIKDGYNLENNGEFNEGTAEAIKQYQIKNGLDTTGEIDIETMNQHADTYRNQ
jgi:hypothetical protein